MAAARRADLDLRRRGKRVQSIALCKRLGLRYSAVGAAPAGPKRKRLRKPPPPPPESLRAWAAANAEFLDSQGWHKLAKSRRGRSELSSHVKDLPHDAAAYLDYLRRCGAPVVTSAAPHTPEQLQAAVDRGPHLSATKEAEFLADEVYEMCKRRHAMVLPFSVVKRMQGVRISPPGVVPQRGRKPRTICNLTHSGVNANTVNLAHSKATQFGTALCRLLF